MRSVRRRNRPAVARQPVRRRYSPSWTYRAPKHGLGHLVEPILAATGRRFRECRLHFHHMKAVEHVEGEVTLKRRNAHRLDKAASETATGRDATGSLCRQGLQWIAKAGGN
jgi:hypothetical protein